MGIHPRLSEQGSRTSLNASLLGAYGSEEHQALEQRLRLLELLQANDFGDLRELFHAFSTPASPTTGIARTNWPATKATTPASSTATSPRWDWTSSWKTAATRAGWT